MTRRAVPKEAERFAPQEAGLALLAEISERIEPDEPGLSTWFENYLDQHRNRLANDLALLEQNAEPGATVLEYGAVPLLLTGALVERGYDLKSLDLAPERFSQAIAQLGLDVRRCDVETEPVPFAAETFDVVLFNELFEHLRIDPIFTLEEVRRVLKPSGTLFLSTPNLRSFRGLKNLILHHQAHSSSAGVYEQYEKLERLGHMGHTREYTAREVADFLERVGFEVEKIIFRGGHGSGIVGLAERVAPSMRPFFSIIATRPADETERA